MSDDLPEIPPENASGPKSFTDSLKTNPKYRNWLLFAIGFAAWYVINGLLWQFLMPSQEGYEVFVAIITLPANLLVLIILSYIRRTKWFAFGLLGAITFNFLINLVLGLFTNGVCMIPFFLSITTR